MKKNGMIALLAGLLLSVSLSAQRSVPAGRSYQELRWGMVANGMPDEWYGSDEARAAAENVLIYQRWSGGWPKNTQFHRFLAAGDRSGLIEDKRNIHDATFDNDATTTEIRFLAKIYEKTRDSRYKEALEDGLIFIFQAQYPNGGWPQDWPLRPGYYSHITINDDATVNNLELLRDVVEGKFPFLDNFFVERSRIVIARGVECLLRMQIVKDGIPTIWCAQHDEYNFMPAMGRTYELPSFSGSESVGVVKFLMSLQNPSPQVVSAVRCAVNWFERHRLTGIRVESVTDADGRRDRVVKEDPAAPAIWARFYDLETEKPFFCGRDGVKRASMAEVEPERRTGYSWYTSGPQELLDAYPEWEREVAKIPMPGIARAWKQVAENSPEEWYGSPESIRVADQVIFYQKSSGGWPKNVPMHQPLTPVQKERLKATASQSATLDNDATTTEMRFLARMYNKTKIKRYRDAFSRGLDFLFDAQYDNGGWPQYYPLQPGNYSRFITYNDDAMVSAMQLLKDIYDGDPALSFAATPAVKARARAAFDKGIDCILKTQIQVNGQPAIWCAQHNEISFAPDHARSYELPSFSGGESTGILLLLMSLDDPSPAIVASVEGAVNWLDEHKIEGIRVNGVTVNGMRDRVVVDDPGAPAIWARFYDLDTRKPYFCGRNGIKVATLAEVEYERRNGYGYYTYEPQAVLDAYPVWKTKLEK